MMSDLAEIAAAAGIDIIDTDDKGDAVVKNVDSENVSVAVGLHLGDLSDINDIQDWDNIFSNRYTESDLDYASAVESAEILSKPPCVVDFKCFRQRNDRGNWNRDRRYNNRGGYRSRGGWNRRGGDGGDSSNWNAADRPRYSNSGDYGGYGDQQRVDRSGYQNREYQQDRGNRSYRNREEGDYPNRRDGGDYRNRRYDDSQESRGRSRNENRDRSPQR